MDRHLMFSYPQSTLSRSKKRRLQRKRQATRLAEGKGGSHSCLETISATYALVLLKQPPTLEILASQKGNRGKAEQEMVILGSKPGTSTQKLLCNMVFVLSQSFKAKEGQPSYIHADVEEHGEIAEILQDSVSRSLSNLQKLVPSSLC
ncbi:hypothetical protein LOK49_LG12G02206 [Camellia lanceoleosa]|uniref:Uncharacterized protein n=1 Tax=Camellia lanceoleosa TaxID=1840588 RepID=A0ACC0FTL3_9ERIC|nr:hypothetical protein LOK49_LG12G02206 [Camellia lanceoleosa]